MIRVWLVTLGNFNYNLLNLKKVYEEKMGRHADGHVCGRVVFFVGRMWKR